MKSKFVFLLLISGLGGCGGGGSSESGGTGVTVQIPQAVTPIETSPELKDNPATEQAQFSQYRNYDLSIDLSQYPMNGNLVFIKLYQSPDKTLYLGKVRDNQIFSVNLPATSTVIYFDLFSESPDDQQISGEIAL
jgi:hypothetical protein